MSLPEPRTAISVACTVPVVGDQRCHLSDADRLNLRNQVGAELQRIEDDFIAAWVAQPRVLGRQIWFTFRTRLDLVIRGLDAPPGTSVPQAYQLITEDVYRRLPALDDLALANMYAATKATTGEQMERSVVDYIPPTPRRGGGPEKTGS